MAGFEYRYRLAGGAPTVETFQYDNPDTLAQGDLLNLQSGVVELGTTGNDSLLGAATATRQGAASTALVDVITDADAVYAVADANARAKDGTLDLAGASGGQGVHDGPNGDLTVVLEGSAGEYTLVRISVGRHARAGLVGGELNAAVARAVVRLHREYAGRGPTKALSFFRGNVIVVVMEDLMTKAEHTLADSGRADAVREIRRGFHEAMRADLVREIEQLSGCRVVAFLSDNHIAPDMATEVFVLDRAIGE
jgi:uncharacterized protein YbcI